jgi:DNA-binding MarR family transcriptional regulator
MSGDLAGAAMGQQGGAGQSSGQQSSGQQGTGQPGTGQPGTGQPEATREQGAGEQAAGRQGAARQESAEPAAGREGGVSAATQQTLEYLSRAGWEVPWPAPPTSAAGPQERAELELAFATAMRRTGSLMQLMGQAAADRIGINNTDLNCLNILSFSGHMTAGELAKATGLTTASITGVIDRLEEAGFVRRERDPHDRRRVVVRLSLDKAVSDVASVFAPMLRDWREMAARYSDDELRLIVDFYGRVEQVFRKHLIRLRDE